MKYTCKVYPATGGAHALLVEVPGAFWPLQRALLDKSAERHGGYLSLDVSLPHKPRSTGWKSQNHRLNGFVSQICKATGNDFDDIKLFVKRRAMRRGLPPKLNGSGQVVYSRIDGEPLPKSETEMSVEECSWCIAETEQLAAEENIQLVEIDNA